MELWWECEWQAAEVTWTAAEADKTQNIDILKQKYTFDINGALQNDEGTIIESQTSTKGWATFDVYINDKLVSANVYDYGVEERYGSKFEIRNLKANAEYLFNGVNTNKGLFADDIKGTVGNPIQTLSNIKLTAVCLQFKEAYSEIITGQNFNKKIKALAGGNLSNIKTFTKSETAPNINSMTSANIISTDDPNSPIYAWYDNGTIFWWSEAEKVYMNVDCNNMFYGCSSLITLSLENFDTSKVTNMSDMFYKCNNITALNLTGFTKIPSTRYVFYCDTKTPLTILNPTEAAKNYNYSADNRTVTFK